MALEDADKFYFSILAVILVKTDWKSHTSGSKISSNWQEYHEWGVISQLYEHFYLDI